MNEVIVLGANGYIGESVCRAFRTAGWLVHGLVRKAEHAAKLEAQEIDVIVASSDDGAKWRDIAARSRVIIDAIGYTEQSEAVLKTVIDASASRAVKPLFIFTSGIMVYGKAYETFEGSAMDENTRLKPIEGHIHGSLRVVFEQRVLQQTAVVPIVLRPGWVYGLSGGPYIDEFFFRSFDASTRTITISGKPTKRYSWVHIEDLSDAYVRIAQSTQYLGGQSFNIVSRDYPSYEQIVVASALAQGVDRKDLKIVNVPAGAGAAMFEVDVVLDPHKAERMLGWNARHIGFVAEMPLYYKAWKRASSK